MHQVESSIAPSSARQNTTQRERQSPSMLLPFSDRTHVQESRGGGLSNREMIRKMHGLMIFRSRGLATAERVPDDRERCDQQHSENDAAADTVKP